MRLIDADALIAEYDRVHAGPPGGARKLMIEAPTIEAEPVKHGRWVKGNMPTYGGYKCSVCHKNTVLYKANYCPNCGAKMEGEANGT